MSKPGLDGRRRERRNQQQARQHVAVPSRLIRRRVCSSIVDDGGLLWRLAAKASLVRNKSSKQLVPWSGKWKPEDVYLVSAIGGERFGIVVYSS